MGERDRQQLLRIGMRDPFSLTMPGSQRDLSTAAGRPETGSDFELRSFCTLPQHHGDYTEAIAVFLAVKQT